MRQVEVRVGWGLAACRLALQADRDAIVNKGPRFIGAVIGVWGVTEQKVGSCSLLLINR